MIQKMMSREYSYMTEYIDVFMPQKSRGKVSGFCRHAIETMGRMNNLEQRFAYACLYYMFSRPSPDKFDLQSPQVTFMWATNIKIDLTMRTGFFEASVNNKELMSTPMAESLLDDSVDTGMFVSRESPDFD